MVRPARRGTRWTPTEAYDEDNLDENETVEEEEKAEEEEGQSTELAAAVAKLPSSLLRIINRTLENPPLVTS